MNQIQILNDRSLLEISGEDRFSFIQGLITNDIYLAKNKLIYTLFLSPQGKYLADSFIIDDGMTMTVDLPKIRVDEIFNKLNMYKLRAKISITKKNSKYYIIASDNAIDSNSYIDPRSPELGYRTITSDVVEHNNHDFYEAKRIDLAVPEGEKDMIYGKSFPLEFGMNNFNAISFSKGCYIGQEVISRTKYRGVIRKDIYKLTSLNSPFPTHGTEILLNGQVIGTTLSSFGNTGLSLLKKEFITDKSIIFLANNSKLQLFT